MDKWNNTYKQFKVGDTPSVFIYSDTISYNKGYEFLKDCNTIEDWGCGTGGFKRFFINDNTFKYKGIDGSITPFADIKADLIKYISNTEGIFMRHVLEHNYDWQIILRNALKSFTKKMCIVLFIDFSEKTMQIAHNIKYNIDVPDLSICKDDFFNIIKEFDNISYTLETFNTNTGYGIEHILYLTKI